LENAERAQRSPLSRSSRRHVLTARQTKAYRSSGSTYLRACLSEDALKYRNTSALLRSYQDVIGANP